MKTSPPASLRPAAFTLIELLTVIAIIAILMGLLFPAINAVRENAKKAQAKSDAMQIVAAVKAYHTEYAKYPDLSNGASSTTSNTEDLFVGDTVAKAPNENFVLFNTLRAINAPPNADNILNPRKIVFFDGKSVSDPESPRGGFLEKAAGGAAGGTAGSYFDPWGKQYTVMVDTNYDNQLDMGQCYTDFSSDSDKPRTGVGAFSMGKDKKLGDAEAGEGKFRSSGKVSDDVISWQ